jgi:hypothetical protein
MKRRTKREEMNSFTRYYRDTICRGATMREVVGAAKKMGWKPPKPKDPTEIMVKQFTEAQRVEMFVDKATGEEYNANICYPIHDGEFEWIDADKAKFPNHVANIHLRRNQAVGIQTQIEKNNRHWNKTHTANEQYEIEHDLSPDVLWNLNQPKANEGTGTDD